MTYARKSATAYLAAVGLCLVVLAWVLDLRKADFSVPLVYRRDAIQTQFWVKGLVENGWYLTNGSLGAPFGLEMHDFPNSDGLFFVLLKAIACFTTDHVRVINAFFLLTFPLSAVSAMFAFRRFAAPRPTAFVGGQLFAFLPYHFLRGQEHLFLASYFLVPLAVMVVLWIHLDERPLFFRGPGDDPGTPLARFRSPRALATIAVCLLISSGGVYYAFFTCYLLLVAGVAASARRRGLTPLWSSGVAIAVISAGALLNVTPKLVYDLRNGPDPGAVVRSPTEADLYGLRIPQLLMPVSGHRVPLLARMRARYDSATASLNNENTSSSLGVVGTLGFLALVSTPLWRKSRGGSRLWEGLSNLNLATLLLCTSGGFGTLFGFFVCPWIRCYNRFSVFIAFLSIFAAVLGLSRVDLIGKVRAKRWPVLVGLAVLLVVGVLDQTTRAFVPRYRELEQEYRGDAEFVNRVEAALPKGSMVFQLPYSSFPEPGRPPEVHAMLPYDHLRGYLHSKSLRWSYGAMRGRYGDLWQASLKHEPVETMVRRLALAGFGGVTVDRKGFADGGAVLEAELGRRLGLAPLVSRDGRFVCFAISDYAIALRRELGSEQYAEAREAALHPVLATWGDGFYDKEVNENGEFRWSEGRGDVTLLNPAAGPQRVELEMTLVTLASEPSSVRIDDPGGTASFPVDGLGRVVRHTVVVPPGSTLLRFEGDGRKVTPPGSNRTLAFRVERFAISGPSVLAGPSTPGTIRR